MSQSSTSSVLAAAIVLMTVVIIMRIISFDIRRVIRRVTSTDSTDRRSGDLKTTTHQPCLENKLTPIENYLE